MSGEGAFQISLPSLDDGNDSDDELFSYPAPRFGHPAKASSLGTHPLGGGPGASLPASHSTESVPTGWHSQQYGAGSGHSRGLSTASSEAYPGAHAGGRKDSVAASSTSGEMPAWMGFGSGRKDSIAASQYSAGGDGPSAFGQQRRDTAGSVGATPKQVQKKGSFVSLKSAFSKAAGVDKTSGKTPAVPPLPDAVQAYPALRNPFSRSASAAHAGSSSTPPTSFATPGGRARSRRPSTAQGAAAAGSSLTSTFWSGGASQPSQRQPALTHHSGPANYSTASSTFAFGSNSSISSPPPPLPTGRRTHTHGLSSASNSFAQSSSATASPLSLPPPSTPPQFAIHLLLQLFQEITTSHIQWTLSANDYPLRRGEPIFAKLIGPGADEDLDRVLDSLGMAAALGGGSGPKPTGPGGFAGQRSGGNAPAGVSPGDAKFVVDNLVKWRNELLEEEIEKGTVRSHLTGLPNASVADVERRLKERRAVSTLYLLLRVTLSIVKHTPSKEVLGEAFGLKMEDMLWRYVVKESSMDNIRRSENKLANRRLLLEVIGKLSALRFETVTDRFLTELERGVKLGLNTTGTTASKADREAEARLETVVRAMDTIQLRVYPATVFEMCADFLNEIAGFFAQTHGSTLKVAYAETIHRIIHPIANTATAEVNHPQWAKAVATIFAQAQKMLKDKYWHVGFPLSAVALCVSPREVFREHWLDLISAGFVRLREKERPHARPIVANAVLRLLWVYLYRCTEESSAAVAKALDAVVHVMFPPRQRFLQPSDVGLDVFSGILHLILLKQFDYGRDLVLQLLAEDRLGEKARASISTGSEELSTPERFTVAIRAVLLTLHALEEDIKTPSFPTATAFGGVSFEADYPSSGEALPETVLAKPGVSDLVQRLNPILSTIALLVDRSHGALTLFDDGISLSRSVRPIEALESGFYAVDHALLRCRIRSDHRPPIALLRTIFDAWPRLIRSSVGIGKTLQIISRGVAHVDPDVTAAATAALKRVACGPGRGEAVAAGFARFLTGDKSVNRAHHVGVRAYEVEVLRLVQTWVDVLEIWLAEVERSPEAERPAISGDALAELDSTALFFLASVSIPVRKLAIIALQKLGQIQDGSAPSDDPPERAISFLETAGRSIEPATIVPAAALSSAEVARLATFTRPVPADFILQWAESGSTIDEYLWYLCYPQVVQRLQLRAPDTMRRFRSLVGRIFLDWKSNIIETARRAASGPAARSAITHSARTSTEHLLSEQWRILVTALCATTSPTGDSSSARVSNQVIDVEAERLSSSKHLFQQIIHFLYSENALFRDAAVTALGHIAQPTLNDLLDTLQRLMSHIYDSAQAAPVRTGKPATPTQTRPPQPEITDLYTAAAHVFERISPLIKDTRSLGDLKLMSAVIQFVDRTLRYLSERAENPHLHPLRRYFCIVVQNLADGVAIVGDPDRHLGRDLRAAIFKQCDQWSNLGRRAEVAQARESKLLNSIDDSLFNSRDRSSVIASVSNHAKHLSVAAADAMAALCRGPFFTVAADAMSSSTPASRAVEADGILAWVRSLFVSSSPASHEVGRKALSSLLQHNGRDPAFMKEVLRQTFSEGDHFELPRSFFAVLVSSLLGHSPPDISYAQRVVLVLLKLAHSDIGVRRRALDLLSASVLPESTFFAKSYPPVGSAAPAVYLRAQYDIADKLASLQPVDAVDIVSELALRVTQIGNGRELNLLRLLPPFLDKIDCSASTTQRVALTDLLFVAVSFGREHPQEIQLAWISLACGPFPGNCSEIVKFLLQQASRRSSAEFVGHARNIVASLAASPVGPTLFPDLCSFIDPAAMVQAPDVDDRPASAGTAIESAFARDLDTLFPQHSKSQALSIGRLALLFVGEVMTDAGSCPNPSIHLTALLHATLTQVDHLYAPIRDQAQALLFQLLWTATANHEAAVEAEDWSWVKLDIGALWGGRHELFWNQDSQPTDELNIPRRMTVLVPAVLEILEPFYPDLRHEWGALAVDWGTSCPDRQLACRSLQLFRVLSPEVTPRMLADMIGRLSNTLADSTPGNNAFCQELLWGFCSIVRSMEGENLLAFPQLFWTAAACLSTTVEEEFAIAIDLLTLILDRLDLDNSDVVNILLENQPPHWSDDDLRLQVLLLPGLRSSVTDQATFDLVCRLAAVESSVLIDVPEDRTMHLFVSSLPWCLVAMDDNDFGPEIVALAENLSAIAAAEGKSGIQRLMLSFAKNRFRTKDDFLRGAVSSIREYFLPQQAFEVVTLLLGFVLNSRDFMREKTLLLLKLVVQSPDAREPLAVYGAELLMPLLRLVRGKLAPQALEVLSEPLSVANGLEAAHVLRMSMTFGAVMHNLASSSGEVFGTPLESGWCVAKADEKSASARQNALAVYETCPQGARIQSPAHFSMQFQENGGFYPNGSQLSLDESLGPLQATEELTLGELVGDLHSLNQFFDDINEDEEMAFGLPRNTSVADSIGTLDPTSERRLADVVRRSARSPSISSIREFESRRLTTPPDGPSPPLYPNASPDSAHGSLRPEGRGSDADRRPSHQKDGLAATGTGFETDSEGGRAYRNGSEGWGTTH